jgi:hypothetical protein
MEFNYSRERRRMCERCESCSGCPLNPTNITSEDMRGYLFCDDVEADFPALAVRIVKEWSDSNPTSVIDHFFEVFPRAEYNYNNGVKIPTVCVRVLGLADKCDEGKCSSCQKTCALCWEGVI